MPRFILTSLVLILAGYLQAQPITATLKGVLTDNSGAVIPGAEVALVSGASQKALVTQVDGSYSFTGLAPGDYTLKVKYPGFVPYESAVAIAEGATITLPVRLVVGAEKQQITVKGESGPTVSVDPDNNANALVVKGTDLDALPDDPDDLSDVLQALAGPGAGPNGGQLFVDGFSGGQLPPKSSIREIRINQNPFSAEYDHLGFGRIDILTKPGSDKFRGGFCFNDSDGFMNTRNPYVDNKPDFSNRFYNANLSGPLNHRSSFFVDFYRRDINNDALINAVTLDPATLASTPVRLSVVTPNANYNISPRVDYLLSTNNTLSARYSYFHAKSDNNGIGQQSLPSRAYASGNGGHELHLTETAILNARAVNETRFGYNRDTTDQYGNSAIPALNVSDSFNAGGAQVGRSHNLTQSYEIQNNTSIGHGRHTFRLGARVRHSSLSDDSPANFGGTFTFFGVGDAPVLDANNQPTGATTQISSLEQYRRTLLFEQLGYPAPLIRTLGGGASQFSIAGGNPLAQVSQSDLGVFAQDDFRVKPNFTLSVGLRYETQSNVQDRRDFAPRLGIAWSPKGKAGKPSTTVVRAGFGMFYDRIAQNLTLQQLRFNGVNQQQFLVMNPDFFPNVPALSALDSQKQPVNTYRLDPTLRAPYMMQSALSLEQQLPWKTTLAATYLNLHALHNLRTVNINAPLPGTFDPTIPGSGLRPYGDAAGNLFLYESNGVMNENEFVFSVNTRFSQKVSLNFAYEITSSNSDVDNNGQPSNPYDFKQDYGRSSFSRRQFANVLGSILLPFNVRMSPMLVLASGPIYNLTSGHDLNGDAVANDRPSFATDLTRPSVVFTQFGAFDTKPLPGQKLVPRDYLTGDPMWNLNMRLGRNFAIGPHKGGGKAKSGSPVDQGIRAPSASLAGQAPAGNGGPSGERRFILNVNIFVNNVFNHVTKGGYVGNLASPLFGQATTLGLFRETSNGRKVQLGTNLNF